MCSFADIEFHHSARFCSRLISILLLSYSARLSVKSFKLLPAQILNKSSRLRAVVIFSPFASGLCSMLVVSVFSAYVLLMCFAVS